MGRVVVVMMYQKGTHLVKQSDSVFSRPQQGYTGRLGPNFHDARKGAGPDRLGGDAVLSPKDSLVAFGLAPCPGSVLWPLWLLNALEPLPAVIPGGSVSLKDAGTWPR